MTFPVRDLRGPLVIAALVIAVDQFTKDWAQRALGDGDVVDVVWKLRFNLAYNRGMAFSRGDGLGPVVPVLAIGVVAVLLIAVGRSSSRWFVAAVGLVIGGALGNVVDRLFRGEGWLRGAVVDFVDLQFWPIFNVADMGIVVGGAVLVLTTLFADDEGEGPTTAVESPAADS